MAEGRRLEDEDEELHERRELGGPRRARGRALSGHSAADPNERNKPEHRASSQGPLSSIRAVIKRSSRTSIQSELHRDRRRPEITIVAAEPLRPTSWFPGAPPPGLAFPPSSAAGPWRPSELVPAELPPSYEQVIKEINQVQVNTTNNNNAAATPRHTITSATQTDFSEEVDNHLPQSNATSASDPPTDETPLIVFDISEEQNCPENTSATRCPVPKPRSKSNLRPVAREPHVKEQNPQKSSPAATPEEATPSRPQPLWDDTGHSDSQAVMNIMNAERSPNTVVSRIKALEGETNAESVGLPKKPEIAPRTVPPRPAASSGKPSVAPKPAADRASGGWDSWTTNRLRGASREGLTPHSPPQEAGSVPVTKPELPKKPNPGLIRSVNPESLGGGSVAESPASGKKAPTPAPRPLLPKKSASAGTAPYPAASETPPYPAALLKPITVPPRLSVASQAKAFRSLGEGPPASPASPVPQSKPPGDIDLISFDDEVLPAPSGNLVEDSVDSEMVLDPFQLPTRIEPAKERAAQPAPTRKPTVIRIPAKPGKCSHEEDPQSPPPLPTEKPIGNTFSTVSGKLGNANRTRNLESDHAGQSGGPVRGPPRLPPRPVSGKVIPARQPPPKGAPERPPPPKLPATRAADKKLPLNRSSSDMDLPKKPSNLAPGLSKAKSQVLKHQDPVPPPRPKPGHPLDRKYTLSVPHGIANEDIVPQNPGELSCKRGDVLVILKQAEGNYLECRKGADAGRVHLSHMKIITPLDEHLRSRPNDPGHAQKPVDSGAPHAVVLHDFPAEQVDDLNLTSGEIVYLLEKVDTDWYRGKCRNQTGVFPATYVKVITDVPGGNGKRESVASHCVKGPRCVARFEYIGDQKDELSFSEGEIILLKEYVNDEWARGELRERSGIFPLNFVELIEDHPTSGANVLTEAKSMAALALKERKAKALYDFHGENEDELSFKAGDIITELESVDDDWMSGELMGKSGIFPRTYIQVLQVG
ncbi:SH3 domain-containing protein 19 isoform X5 [Mesoplodon densirostris]|uniref:SH3 domain-containing protein 19 isoform X5 n=1 Tax=Mesoplodon densirostris TaxID=48708 RepID=UPI0028DBC2BE|nr:SH3 domain-containing protein 19 isoform X5 [Mesoplodon densirostris]